MRKQKKQKNRMRIWIPVILFVLFAGAMGLWIYESSLTYRESFAEAGTEILPQTFFKKPVTDAVFTAESQPFDTHVPGEYAIRVKSGLFTHRCKLIIQDTVPPQAEVAPVTLSYGETCGAETFVSVLEDATAVTIGYVEQPDFERTGEQSVRILFTDLGENQVLHDTTLVVAPVVPALDWEAGKAAPTVADFMLTGEQARLLTTDLDTSHVLTHEVKIESGGRTYQSLLQVVDTMAPMAEVQDFSGYTLLPLDAMEFVVSIEDATEVAVTFAEEPDISKPGDSQVQIVFTDEGGNSVTMPAELHLEEDTEPPVIKGVKDTIYVMGTSMAYRKNVTVLDNSGEELALEIDNSQVDLETEGIYPVTYSATDTAGNNTTVTVNVTVIPQTYDLNEVYERADAVLAKILRDDMTEYEKLEAIFNYVRSNIGYLDHSDKGDWVKAAYEGLVKKQGDCYVYASTTKVLLDRAGITNMDIAKIPARRNHYWNLVDIGEGWHHLDTTPRRDHPTIFYWTDEQLMEYSARHSNSHNYDRDLYPEIQ